MGTPRLRGTAEQSTVKHIAKMKMKKMEDRVSNLPDEILCYILSFLPIKEAVATSVLCKRWKPLWRSLLTLNFDDSRYILSRDFNQPIQRFRLRCSSARPSLFDFVSAAIWANAVVQRRRVKRLDVSLPFVSFIHNTNTPSNLSSPSIFSCRTLVVLKLQGLKFESFSSVDVDLPLLKVLHLESLSLADRGCLAALLSRCPVLEDLRTRLCFTKISTHREFRTLPNLVRAGISAESTNIFMMKVVNNVRFLQMHQIDRSLPHNVEGMFHNLIHLVLVYANFNGDWFTLVKFLNHCPKLRVLVVKQPQFHRLELDELDLGDWKEPPSVPKCILLHLKVCFLQGYRGIKGEFQFARYIMRNGRFLKMMKICNSTAVNERGMHNNLHKLSSCTRRSTTCKLKFE